MLRPLVCTVSPVYRQIHRAILLAIDDDPIQSTHPPIFEVEDID